MRDGTSIRSSSPFRETPPRRPRIVALASALLVAVVGLRVWLPSLPTRQWIEDELHGTVVAYEVTPAGGFVALDVGRRLVFDKLRVDFWSFNNWPPFWRWQLVGLGHGAPRTGAPASVALAACPGDSGNGCGTPPWIFGEVNDPAIVALAVDRGGATIRYSAAAPGFAIQLAPLAQATVPTTDRWLDAAGHVVWQSDRPGAGFWPGASREERRAQRERLRALKGRAPAASAAPSEETRP